MLNSIFTTTSTGTVTLSSFLICAGIALLLGALIAWAYTYRNQYKKGFVVTLVLLPVMVQTVICVVNGNLGVGVAVAGAFGLIRFRSAEGGGREIGSVFLSMAVGLALGMGYALMAVVVALIVSLVQVALMASPLANGKKGEQELRITIPENLDYNGAFTDLFATYTSHCSRSKVKTTNMGAMYELTYQVVLKDPDKEKEFLDVIRCRNGNLNVSLGRIETKEERL